MDSKKKSNSKRAEETKKLVKYRLSTVPSHLEVSIGSKKFSRDQLIEDVEKESRLGKQVIEIHMKYLRSLASGEVAKRLADN